MTNAGGSAPNSLQTSPCFAWDHLKAGTLQDAAAQPCFLITAIRKKKKKHAHQRCYAVTQRCYQVLNKQEICDVNAHPKSFSLLGSLHKEQLERAKLSLCLTFSFDHFHTYESLKGEIDRVRRILKRD